MTDPVLLVTDGSALGNPGPGGYAALLRLGAHERLIVGSEPHTTNNRMELRAVIEGLKALRQPRPVLLRSDSRYVVDGLNAWLANWQRRGYKTAAGVAVLNQDLWKELAALIERAPWQAVWVKAHAGDVDNERVDRAAREAARAQLPQAAI